MIFGWLIRGGYQRSREPEADVEDDELALLLLRVRAGELAPGGLADAGALLLENFVDLQV